MTRFRRQLKVRLFLLGLTACVLIFSIIPVRLAIARYQAPDPQAILVLGGGPDREVLAAEIARFYPTLDIWVSTGSAPDYLYSLFAEKGVAGDRLHLDYRAVDTVTNFTTLVSDFKQRRIQHLLLITSRFHMPRALAIATIVLGSQGITVSPLSSHNVHSDGRESIWRILRDVGRSLLWVVSGRTGASLKDEF